MQKNQNSIQIVAGRVDFWSVMREGDLLKVAKDGGLQGGHFFVGWLRDASGVLWANKAKSK